MHNMKPIEYELFFDLYKIQASLERRCIVKLSALKRKSLINNVL
jgi:hypothetical protein